LNTLVAIASLITIVTLFAALLLFGVFGLTAIQLAAARVEAWVIEVWRK
jgi:hypothetical protein